MSVANVLGQSPSLPVELSIPTSGVLRPLTLSATTTLTSAQFGFVIFPTAPSAAYSITLPTALTTITGATYFFVVPATLANAVTISVPISGSLFGVIAGTPFSADTNVIIGTSAAAGTLLNFVNNGLRWFVDVNCSTGITTS
jgi:hypothetical protein